MSNQKKFDIAIIGAGPSGCATALGLVKKGFNIALIERPRGIFARADETLPPNIRPYLEELGTWKAFLSLDSIPCYGIRSIWGSEDYKEHTHIFNPWGCGWHINRSDFDLMMTKSVLNAGVSLLSNTIPLSCELKAQGWEIKLKKMSIKGMEPGPAINAKVLIDASGRKACLKKWVGAKLTFLDHLVGIGMKFNEIDTLNEGYLLVESCKNGWWYSSMQPQNGMMVVLLTDGDICKKYKFNKPQSFTEQLCAATVTLSRVKGGIAQLPPIVFNAASHRLRRREFTTPWLAVGDASFSVDPLSGNGIVHAFESAQRATETVGSLLKHQNSKKIEQYENEVDVLCVNYLFDLSANYAIENRWPGNDFWRRRIAFK